MISADLEEIFRICDRILVLYRGEIVANLETEKTSIEEVGSFRLQGITIMKTRNEVRAGILGIFTAFLLGGIVLAVQHSIQYKR